MAEYNGPGALGVLFILLAAMGFFAILTISGVITFVSLYSIEQTTYSLWIAGIGGTLVGIGCLGFSISYLLFRYFFKEDRKE
jgi:hypothetical protein